MAVRTTMLTLINFVRGKIGDPDNGSPVFSTQDIQDALDATRFDVAPYEILIPAYSYVNAAFVWLDHYSRFPFWEDGATLLDLGLNPITASLTEPLREPDADGKAAHFQFSTSQINVRARGHSFDVWQVAANLLEQMILLQAPLNINFSAGGSSFQLNQITQVRMQLVAQYRSKQRIGFIQTVRDDVQSKVDYEKERRIGITSAGVPFIDGR